ncbi:MAG: multicopper oxidase domain-containing protein [Acidobacteria bacterium]|nr:multicopper oxidase domain-containing protein [Acidobacteriota bacterium]
MPTFSRRTWLQATGLASLAGSLGMVKRLSGQGIPAAHGSAHLAHESHAMGTMGRTAPDGFNASTFLTAWNFSDLSPDERSKFYRETPRPDGSVLREYEIFATDREIEIAPGIFFPAWTYNGQVPGPTIRATEGDRLRVTFRNLGTHPHSMHFHGWHAPEMDGALTGQEVHPGETFVYEFDADPFGLHLYHCHTVPLKRHIHKGLYGAFIIDPRSTTGVRPPAQELVMVMNAFDTTFDSENEVYAVNTVANAYMHEPIRVTVGQRVRMYLVNVTEFDPINSLHLHAVFFDVFRTGTSLTPSESTDTIMLCQGERAILETTFRYPGDFMFHAHQSEFAELGWMGLFRAEAPRT